VFLESINVLLPKVREVSSMPIRLAQVIWISPDSDAMVRFRTSP